VPAVAGSVAISSLISATLSYVEVDGSSTAPARDVTIRVPACTIARPEVAEPQVRDVVVDTQINRFQGIEVIEQATLLADQNRLDEARAIVTAAKERMAGSVSASHALTQAMITDLTACMGRFESRQEWESFGRCEQIETQNVHKMQRGLYGKGSRYCAGAETSASAYSNNRSRAGQKKASK
jgi:hypothetical protein